MTYILKAENLLLDRITEGIIDHYLSENYGFIKMNTLTKKNYGHHTLQEEDIEASEAGILRELDNFAKWLVATYYGEEEEK